MKKIIAAIIIAISPAALFAQLSLQLTPSDYNGYNISCFGGRDGAIDLTITGGYPPYSIVWSNSSADEDLYDLASGYYRVEVTDVYSGFASAEITLTEPEMIGAKIITSSYLINGREFNISLYGACNGTIQVMASGGAAPYTYLWNEISGQSLLNNVCAGKISLLVIDNNGCKMGYKEQELIIMTEPPRDDWTMIGNSGTDSATQFIGTTDNQDFVFRTNNSERMRLTNSGSLKINELSGNGTKYLISDNNGKLSTSPGVPWETRGNDNINTVHDFIGTLNNANFIFKTNAISDPDPKMILTTSGNVSVGNTPPVNKLDVAGGVAIGTFAMQNQAPSGGLIVSGDVGIGTSSISSGVNLEVNGKTKTSQFMISSGAASGHVLQSDASGNASWVDPLSLTVTGDNLGNHQASQNLKLNNQWLSNDGDNEGIIINNDGIVGIGIDPSSQTYNTGNYKLVIGGKVGVREDLYVRSTGPWPDYVFSNDYRLLTIGEMSNFIKKYKRLPGMPPASEIEKEGQPVGEIQKMQQEKIEEFTLYIIQLEERIAKLEKKKKRN